MELILQRLTSGPTATLGCLLYNQFPRWYTMEPPWRNNETSMSCIPPGIYQAVRRTDSTKAPLTFELNVPARSHILCGHVGNYVRDTMGCILFGKSIFGTPTEPYLYDSRSAYGDFMAIMKEYEKWTLHVLKEPQV